MTRARTRACGAAHDVLLVPALFAMPAGPAGTDKAAAEQGLLDAAMERFPALLDPAGSGSWTATTTGPRGSPG